MDIKLFKDFKIYKSIYNADSNLRKIDIQKDNLKI